MIQKLRMFHSDNRPWFYLVGTAIWGIVIAIAVLLMNTRVLPASQQVPAFLLTSVSLSQTILGTLAGALLTITTFTFSTTLVVLTTYSSNYSPRIVENFLQEKNTMSVLGTFIGGFIYAITSLYFLGEHFTGAKVLSGSVAIVYAVWCVVQFVVFIFSVSSSLQTQNLIARLYEDAKGVIDHFIAHNKSSRTDQYQTDPFSIRREILSQDSGYLVAVDNGEIHRTLNAMEYCLVIHPQIGDFVSKGDVVAMLHCNSDDEALEKLLEVVRGCFSFSHKRFTITDYRYALQKIVDIALRAISPGINDPNTAISCIHSLGLLTGSLGAIEGDFQILKTEPDEDKHMEIVSRNFNFNADLYTTYGQLVHYGKEDISVVSALLDAIAGALTPSSRGNRVHLHDMAQYIYDKSISQFDHPADIAQLNQRMGTISLLVDKG